MYWIGLLLQISYVIAFGWYAPSNRRASKYFDMKDELIVGINKYSHDASCCVLNSAGKILFAQAKERVTRRKHDGGAVGELISYALDAIGASVDDIKVVVSNNHHNRVLPYEKRLPWYTAMKYCPSSYIEQTNLIQNAKHFELSHHMAHAWSAISTSGLDQGLVVVMDGMGESYKAMREDITGVEQDSGDYMHDLKLLKSLEVGDFTGVPRVLNPSSGYREAESAYVFSKNSLRPVFKRWSRERSPPELYNHGFENHESMGAVYSRISSQIFGDWNACGKVMGLAPWSSRTRTQQQGDLSDWYFSSEPKNPSSIIGSQFYHQQEFMTGNPFNEASFKVCYVMLCRM